MLDLAGKRLGGVLVAVCALGALVAVQIAPASNNANYRGFAHCNQGDRTSDPSCHFGADVAATLIAKQRADVNYRLCVRRAMTDEKQCFFRKTGNAGSRSVIPLFNKPILSQVGLYYLRWHVNGNLVAKDSLRMLAGD